MQLTARRAFRHAVERHRMARAVTSSLSQRLRNDELRAVLIIARLHVRRASRLFYLAVTSIFSQRLLRRMKLCAVFIACNVFTLRKQQDLA